MTDAVAACYAARRGCPARQLSIETRPLLQKEARRPFVPGRIPLSQVARSWPHLASTPQPPCKRARLHAVPSVYRACLQCRARVPAAPRHEMRPPQNTALVLTPMVPAVVVPTRAPQRSTAHGQPFSPSPRRCPAHATGVLAKKVPAVARRSHSSTGQTWSSENDRVRSSTNHVVRERAARPIKAGSRHWGAHPHRHGGSQPKPRTDKALGPQPLCCAVLRLPVREPPPPAQLQPHRRDCKGWPQRRPPRFR